MWKSVEPVDFCISTMQILTSLDKDNSHLYGPTLQDLFGEKAIVTLQGSYLDLADRGYFFTVFENLFNTFHLFGLHTDKPLEELWRLYDLDEYTRNKRVIDWLNNGAEVPPSTIREGTQVEVCIDYLIIGSYLFRPPHLQKKELAVHRSGFDQEARHGIQDILKFASTSVNVPAPIRAIIATQSKELEKRIVVSVE